MRLCAAGLDALPGLRHGFFTRLGGVSEGPFAGLNCGFASGDAPQRVAANRARAMAALGLAADALATVRQVHGIEVAVIEAVPPGPPTVRADGLVTARPGIALGVLGADCPPILLADPVAGVLGAAHAGWRGALSGIAEATVRAMVGLGAEPGRIRAAIGPAIGLASYEVGPDMQAAFAAADPGSEARFAPIPGGDRLRLDLKAYVAHRLARAGVAACEIRPEDTYAEPARFFSARRARQAGDGRFGLLLSAIAQAG
jgi:hypothetical protein